MLRLIKVTYKNFLSSGEVPIEIELDKKNLTLISGANGTGKTTILQAIVYGLYGVPFAKINIPQLVNSINKKNCLVTIEFFTNNKHYLVKRGQKPGIFEIWEEGLLLNQPGDKKDYQDILEKQILKMSYKVFKQIVILSKADYIPFLRLPAGTRREVIDDVLDIKLFTVMNSILGNQIKATKDKIKDNDYQLQLIKEKVELQSKFISSIESERESRISDIEQKINEIENDKISLNEKLEILLESLEKNQEESKKYANAKDDFSKLDLFKTKIEGNIKKSAKEYDFYTTTEVCPTCQQEINEDHKSKLMSDINSKLTKFNDGLKQLHEKLDEVQLDITKEREYNSAISKLNLDISNVNSSISSCNKLVESHLKSISEIKSNSTNLDDEKSKLKEFAKDGIRYNDLKNKYNVERNVQEIAKVILQDSGIKSKIIKQYIPILNKLMNKHLEVLDFYVLFNLDENFNEVILSRYRDNFTYESFSEGQKLRLDIALLFSLREIAKLKNSVNCNLLFLDETLDASLDEDGIENLFKIFDINPSMNIFVISHREMSNMIEKFHNHIKITMKNNFSVVEQS